MVAQLFRPTDKRVESIKSMKEVNEVLLIDFTVILFIEFPLNSKI